MEGKNRAPIEYRKSTLLLLNRLNCNFGLPEKDLQWQKHIECFGILLVFGCRTIINWMVKLNKGFPFDVLLTSFQSKFICKTQPAQLMRNKRVCRSCGHRMQSSIQIACIHNERYYTGFAQRHSLATYFAGWIRNINSNLLCTRSSQDSRTNHLFIKWILHGDTEIGEYMYDGLVWAVNV